MFISIVVITDDYINLICFYVNKIIYIYIYIIIVDIYIRIIVTILK